MNIEQIWSEQFQLQQLWHDWKAMSELERDALVKELLLNLHKQTHELQAITDQSSYHILKQKRDLDPYMLADAGVGVLKLLVALMLARGVNPDTFMRAWSDVTKRVQAKWRWEQDELAKAEVLLCDLDGVVAKYAEGFRDWCGTRGYVAALKGNINKPELESIKDEFHAQGGFTGLEPFDGAVEILNTWRSARHDRRLVMVTARPYRQYKQVYGDTVGWLQHHGVAYDHILFERDKAEAVRLVQPARIVAHIEDRGKHALEVAATGVKVLKMPYASPEERISHPLIIPVSGWGDISRHLILEHDDAENSASVSQSVQG